jgi:hypothetical protein
VETDLEVPQKMGQETCGNDDFPTSMPFDHQKIKKKKHGKSYIVLVNVIKSTKWGYP